MLLNDLRKNITDTIIQSNLSIDCIYFVLRDIMTEVVDLYNKQLENEENETVEFDLKGKQEQNQETEEIKEQEEKGKEEINEN
jgi:hypothetical protein